MKITIARQCGSGGHEVAEALAEKLNLEIFDKKRFVEEAKKRNVYDENANFLNEKPIDSFLYSIAMSYGATNPRDRYIDFVKELQTSVPIFLQAQENIQSYLPPMPQLLLLRGYFPQRNAPRELSLCRNSFCAASEYRCKTRLRLPV